MVVALLLLEVKYSGELAATAAARTRDTNNTSTYHTRLRQTLEFLANVNFKNLQSLAMESGTLRYSVFPITHISRLE